MLPERIARLPCWSGTPDGALLSGGLSNEIWKVTDAKGPHVVRLVTDYPFHHVIRSRELMTTRAAHAAGFAPAVEHAEPGVMVTAFITSRTLTPADIGTDPARIARLLRDFHRQMPEQVSGPAFLFWVFHVIRDYARTLTEAQSRWTPDLPRLLALNSALEATQPPLPLVFGHNDLLPANFLDDGSRLWLIDYEYAGFSTAMFDLAGAASNAGLTADQSTDLLTTYLGQRPDPAFLRAFDAMQCASLLREGMWGMVSALYLRVAGVDYDAYAKEHIDRMDILVDRFQSSYGRMTP
ncbi:MAG: phosphotransferase family protein [Rhodobacterales bacterium]|nr:phosphotransferase family protein [Rhodobacterales bacterium]